MYMIDDKRTFGQIVRAARLNLRRTNPDFSLRKFAVRVGISPTYLSKAETDEFQPPRAEKVVRIAEELGIDKYVLLSKANHVAPELKTILLKRQSELSELILLVSDMPTKQISALVEKIRETREDS